MTITEPTTQSVPALFRPPTAPRTRRLTTAAPPHPLRQAPARGEIWFVSSRSNDPEMGSHRSVGREIWSNKLAVVISNDRMNGSAGVVQIVYLTTSTNKRPSRLHVRIDLPADEDVPFAIALCEQVHTVDKTRLTTFCGTVDAEQMKNLEEAVSWSLGIHDNEN